MACEQRGGEPSCTVDELFSIIIAPSGGMIMLPSKDMDQVFPNLYIGDESAARSRYTLQRLGFTHVLNTCLGPEDGFHCNMEASYYQKVNISFLGIAADDHANCRLSDHFTEAADFIHEALENKGKVLVHCCEGRSRSATVVLAFLMLRKHITVQDAFRLVRRQREINPNFGFMQQLCDLNDNLIESGHLTPT